MGTHISYFIDKPVNVDGKVEWERISHNIPVFQSYDLFGWLADVRNYNNIPPLTSYRGTPDDMKHLFGGDYWDSDLGGDRPHSWVMASEILQGVDNFQPVEFSGALGRSQYYRWDKKTEPDCYSRHTESSEHRKILSMDSEQVKRESGYLSHLYRELGSMESGKWISRSVYRPAKLQYDWQTGKNVHVPAGWFADRTYREKPSKKKHRAKLLKYAKRTGNYDIHAKWTVDYKVWEETYSWFLDEIRKLYSEHGDVRMVMSFN